MMHWWTLACLWFGFVGLLPQAQAPTEACLRFHPEWLDLGAVKAGQVIERTVQVHNPRSYPVTVLQIKTSCGCTRHRIEPATVLPGGTAHLHLQFNTLGRPAGAQGWRVQLQVETPQGAQSAEMIVKADVEQELQISPAELTIYGGTRTTQHHITIRDLRSNRSLKVIKVESSSERIKAAIATNEPEAGATARPPLGIQLTIEGGFDVGVHEERLLIHTNDPQYALLQLPITIHRRGPQRFTSLPPMVDFRTQSTASQPHRVITLRDARGETINITKLSSTSKAVQAKVIRSSPGSVQIQVTWDRSPAMNERDFLQIELQGQPVPLNIPILFD